MPLTTTPRVPSPQSTRSQPMACPARGAVTRRDAVKTMLRLVVVMMLVTRFAELEWFGPLRAAEEKVQFNRDVRPILSDRCLLCHGPDDKTRHADLRLDLREAAVESAIVPGNANESELISRILSTDEDERMPPAHAGRKPLTESEINILKRWINEGAEYQSHWAFIPPQRPELPAVSNPDWVRQPLDQFVMEPLDRAGLKPSAEADRRTWLRRVSLDLTGLPPSVDEVRAFLNDTTPEAYEKVVDRLLASSAYGEHFAREWLDAARYADTNGYQYDLEREQWGWRDWVIHALNTNLPFDQFTIQQLAGDLLPDATDQTRLATGLHRNHPITIEGGVIDEEYRTEYVVDRVNTTATIWLGLTLNCARCHDHKYDPFTQTDFYQIFDFFNQVPERGLNGFDPKLKVASPLLLDQLGQQREALAAAEQRLREELATHANEVAIWERKATEESQDPWVGGVPERFVSTGGATMTLHKDRSVLVGGKSPANDVYEIDLAGTGETIHALRLEALTDESFVEKSAGRAFNGNFVLSEVVITVAEAASKKPQGAAIKESEPLKIRAAEADYSQASFDISLAIDGKIDRGGWAVDGNTRHENCTAVFHLAEPLTLKQGELLRVRLHFTYGQSHAIGRFRISEAHRPVGKMAAEIAAIVGTPASKRTEAQQSRLAEFLAETYGSPELVAMAQESRRLRESLTSVTAFPTTMVMQDRPQMRKTHRLERGEYDKPREEVSAGTPAALPPFPEGAPRNRLGFAQWLVAPGHPLTARVTVNRYWQHFFGTGLVKTTEDFGSQGDYPSHPALLDWLAVDFVESGWDTKRLLKQIVLSATYRQSSVVDDATFASDPENRHLARGPRMRLDAEVIRDSALKVSGLLTNRVGGESVFPYHPAGLWEEINNRPGYSRTWKQSVGDDLYRRSLYTFWKRTLPHPSMQAFDAPEREFCIVRRSKTNTPLQAFVLLHDPQFVEAARHLGGEMLDHSGTVEEKLSFGFEAVTAREPSDRELAILKELLSKRLVRYRGDRPAAESLLRVGDSPLSSDSSVIPLAAYTSVARTLLNLSEFVTKP
ncbi:MAG: PSD1 and planctomycete cytochrome C domain-containing protein [Planctomycetaceae bacterium]